MKKYIIFGNSNYNTLGAIHCMSDKKAPFFLLLVSSSYFNTVLLSRYVKEYKIVTNEEQGVLFLMSQRDKWKDSVILPTSDNAESALDKHFDELLVYYRFPNAGKQGRVNMLMNKQIQIEIAADSGLHVPVTFSYKKGESLPKGIVYPCIAKPQNSITGKKEILHEINNEVELLNVLNSSQFTEDFLIQQYIDKKYDILLIGCRFPNGQIWIPGIFKKERWYLKGSDGSYGIISTHVDAFFKYQAELRVFLEKINYYGPFSVEFGVMNNVPYFYEINLRNDGTSHYFHKAGIYIPYIYYLANIGAYEQSHLPIVDGQYSFIDEFGDITNLKTTGLSFKQWMSDLHHASSYKYFYNRDLMPFLALAPRRIIASLYRILN